MPVFLDAGYFIALFNTRDPYYAIARRWMIVLTRSRRPQLTTTAILLEVGDGFARRESWHRIRAFLRTVCFDSLLTVVPVDCALFDRARRFKEARDDKGWGLTDCISFLTMQDHGVTEALAADRHFVQAEFRALLLEPPP